MHMPTPGPKDLLSTVLAPSPLLHTTGGERQALRWQGVALARGLWWLVAVLHILHDTV